jgi:CheY-like chemotaxis protein
MHIAVCDDNIADRKQTERLLGRQSDRIFKETGERIYIDSYGNVEALMHYPQMYDGLFVDMVQEEPTGFEVAKLLVQNGVTRPIILLVSSVDYRKQAQDSDLKADNILFMDKPIKVAEITAMVDEIKKAQGDPVKALELRGQSGTVYVKNDDIVCVRKKGPELDIFLSDGRTVSLIDDIYNFYDQCVIFPQICPISETGLINVNHIRKSSLFSVTMDNNETFKIAFIYRNAIKQAKELISQ